MVTSNFSFSRCVFKRLILQTCKNHGWFGKGLKTENLFGMGGKNCGKRRKSWLPAFSLFPTMFSKGLFFRVVKSLDCVVKS